MPTIDELLAEATPRTVTTRVLLRQDLLSTHAELAAELDEAVTGDVRTNRDPVAPGLAKRLVALEAEIDAAKRPFVFRSIGKRAWADLLALHPPTKDQLKANNRLDHNPSTFPIAAIAASCVDPALTEVEVRQLDAVLNASQFDLLWGGCIDANVGGTIDPKSVVAGSILRVNGTSGTSVVNTESLDLSSSDE